MTEAVQSLEENTQLLEALIVKQDDDKNTFEAERDAQDIATNEMQSQIKHLEMEIEQYVAKLKVSNGVLISYTFLAR